MRTPASSVLRWFGQETALHNATRACIRQAHERRRREDVLAWLEDNTQQSPETAGGRRPY